MSELSGKDWWHKNQSRYPNSRDVQDLAAGFQENVVRFTRVLREGGAKVQVSSTRRNPIRAYLMHYSWRLGHEEIAAADIPQMAGVNIEWDHGDEKTSQSTAREMQELFNIAYRPSLTSNHIKGLAIDMDIQWSGDLFLGPLPDGSFQGVVDGRRTGADNRDLHAIGELFDVHKLRKDPPHWSYDGR